jgi:hypothetical protein
MMVRLSRLNVLIVVTAMLALAACETASSPRTHERLAPIPAASGDSVPVQPQPSSPTVRAMAPQPTMTATDEQVISLLATLYIATIEARHAAGFSRFVLMPPQGPAAAKAGAASLSAEWKKQILIQIKRNDIEITWDDDEMTKNRWKRSPGAGGFAFERISIEFDWISPDRTSARVITYSAGEVRAAFRRLNAQWSGSTWILTEAKPGIGW